MRFIGATIKTKFVDGTFSGKIIAHIEPNQNASKPIVYDDDPKNDGDTDDGQYGERFVVQWENGKRSMVGPQEMLGLLEGGAPAEEQELEQEQEQEQEQKQQQQQPTPKPKPTAKPQDALLGRHATNVRVNKDTGAEEITAKGTNAPNASQNVGSRYFSPQ